MNTNFNMLKVLTKIYKINGVDHLNVIVSGQKIEKNTGLGIPVYKKPPLQTGRKISSDTSLHHGLQHFVRTRSPSHEPEKRAKTPTQTKCRSYRKWKPLGEQSRRTAPARRSSGRWSPTIPRSSTASLAPTSSPLSSERPSSPPTVRERTCGSSSIPLLSLLSSSVRLLFDALEVETLEFHSVFQCSLLFPPRNVIFLSAMYLYCSFYAWYGALVFIINFDISTGIDALEVETLEFHSLGSEVQSFPPPPNYYYYYFNVNGFILIVWGKWSIIRLWGFICLIWCVGFYWKFEVTSFELLK